MAGLSLSRHSHVTVPSLDWQEIGRTGDMSSNSRKCSGGERDKGRDQGGGGRLRSRVDSAAERWNTKRRRRARYREILPRLTPNPNPKNQERGVELLYWRLARKREAEPSAGAVWHYHAYTCSVSTYM